MNCIDDSRLEQFRQLKKEIRASEKYLIVGIDAAKDKHNAFFGTARGKTLVKNLVFDNTLEGFQKLLAYVERIKVQYGLTIVVFGIEPTASYHKGIACLNCLTLHSLVLFHNSYFFNHMPIFSKSAGYRYNQPQSMTFRHNFGHNLKEVRGSAV